jgi:tetratricopeptide (TPR) repeat protein
MAYQNLGKADLAMKDYDRALIVDSNQAAVLTSRGMIYRGRGELQKAIDEFTKALALRDDSDTYFERAQTYDVMKDYPKAIADLDKVVAALRDAPHVLRARALMKQKLGDRAGYLEDLAAAEGFEKRAKSGQEGPKN